MHRRSLRDDYDDENAMFVGAKPVAKMSTGTRIGWAIGLSATAAIGALAGIGIGIGNMVAIGGVKDDLDPIPGMHKHLNDKVALTEDVSAVSSAIDAIRDDVLFTSAITMYHPELAYGTSNYHVQNFFDSNKVPLDSSGKVAIPLSFTAKYSSDNAIQGITFQSGTKVLSDLAFDFSTFADIRKKLADDRTYIITVNNGRLYRSKSMNINQPVKLLVESACIGSDVQDDAVCITQGLTASQVDNYFVRDNGMFTVTSTDFIKITITDSAGADIYTDVTIGSGGTGFGTAGGTNAHIKANTKVVIKYFSSALDTGTTVLDSTYKEMLELTLKT